MSSNEFIDQYGPVAVITGASSGIGKAFAEALAAKRLNLVLVARRLQRLEEMAARLSSHYGIEVSVCEADLSRIEAVDQVASAVAGKDIGLLVSNAGFSLKGPHSTIATSRLTEMLMVNCHAPMLLARQFIPGLQARGRGGIIFTSSIEGLMGCPYSTAYSATKALVNSLGEGLWGELTPDGIDVLALCPGATDTEAMSLQGIDTSKIDNMMAPEAVAKLALENIKNGPVFIASEHYKAKFEQLTSLPRRNALAVMAKTMKP